MYRGGANTIGKQHFTSLYSRAREAAVTSQNIKAGWSGAGLRPFNPQRVLKDIQKPQAEHCPRKELVKVEPCPQDEILQTPVTAEALTSLHNLVKQNAHTLDDTSKRYQQKLANAAQNSFAECALLLDENRLLFEQNNESESRKSVRSTVVGKAKVMSYEDIIQAKLKRDVKDTPVVKGKPGRKRKSSAPVAVQAKRKRRSELEIAEQEIQAEGLGDYCSVIKF